VSCFSTLQKRDVSKTAGNAKAFAQRFRMSFFARTKRFAFGEPVTSYLLYNGSASSFV
jgi:hypothetical protein